MKLTFQIAFGIVLAVFILSGLIAFSTMSPADGYSLGYKVGRVVGPILLILLLVGLIYTGYKAFKKPPYKPR